MKIYIRLFAIALFISFSVSAMSCAKDNYKHNYKSKRHPASSSAMSVQSKKQPVRKNYIIPDKKKKILGQENQRSL